MASSAFEKTLARAIALLAFKQRSRAELHQHLSEMSNDDTALAVITRLEEIGYINDEKFASSLASSRIAIKPLGRARLRRDLQRRKLPHEIIERALDQTYDETSEESLIDAAIEKRVRLRGKPATREDAQRLFAHLVRLGFGYDLVFRKVRELSAESCDDSE
jgi:regulatory protein